MGVVSPKVRKYSPEWNSRQRRTQLVRGSQFPSSWHLCPDQFVFRDGRIQVQIETQTGLNERAASPGYVDVGIETVNQECLGKHETVWHAERELQSNL